MGNFYTAFALIVISDFREQLGTSSFNVFLPSPNVFQIEDIKQLFSRCRDVTLDRPLQKTKSSELTLQFWCVNLNRSPAFLSLSLVAYLGDIALDEEDMRSFKVDRIVDLAQRTVQIFNHTGNRFLYHCFSSMETPIQIQFCAETLSKLNIQTPTTFVDFFRCL